MAMIIGRFLTALNASGTMECVRAEERAVRGGTQYASLLMTGGAAMRPNRFWFSAFSLSLFLIPRPLLAHHSFAAAFDLNESIVVEGVVTKVVWVNPHISFQVDVTDQNGKVTNWGIDGAPPAALARRGLKGTELKPGDVVTIEGAPGRNGRPFVAASMVTLADGREVYFGGDGVTR